LNVSFANKKKLSSRNQLRSNIKSDSTPQAVGLKNHYGDQPIGSQYGPQNDQYAQIIELNPETYMPFKTDGKKKILKALEFKPYPGYEKKLNPHQIKSGDMTNIAPTASKIINPEITGPKLHVQAEVQYPSIVELPTFKGMKKQYHAVTAYDKETGQIVHDKVLINAPEYKMEKSVKNVIHNHEELINLNTGERIVANKEKKLHAK